MQLSAIRFGISASSAPQPSRTQINRFNKRLCRVIMTAHQLEAAENINNLRIGLKTPLATKLAVTHAKKVIFSNGRKLKHYQAEYDAAFKKFQQIISAIRAVAPEFKFKEATINGYGPCLERLKRKGSEAFAKITQQKPNTPAHTQISFRWARLQARQTSYQATITRIIASALSKIT